MDIVIIYLLFLELKICINMDLPDGCLPENEKGKEVIP